MRPVGAALETYRYWLRMEQICANNAAKVDRIALQSALDRQRPDIAGILARIRSTGIAVVDGYWSTQRCAAGRAEIDRLIATYPEFVKTYSAGSDQRMFGVESASPLLATFHDDPFLRGLGELVGGFDLYNFATLGARIAAMPGNNGSGDGWHRDGHGFQFKSILYLSDVSDENGPFEFLSGSHKRWRAAFDTAIGSLPPPPNSRYDPVMIDRMVGSRGTRVRYYPAKAGTLLLVNTSGMHRGRPLVSGTRYALTNYFYHPFQVSEDRIEQFSPLIPGTAERVRADLLSG